MPTPISPETLAKYLEHVPPLKLIEFVNKKKAEDIQKALAKISSLAHFSQSMADYYARDDALEPALAVVCEVLKNTGDIGGLFEKRGTTFLSLAQPYEKERSKEDQQKTESQNRNQTKNRNVPCFRFQQGACRLKNCLYRHECKNCGSRYHGSENCRRWRKKRKKSEERKSKR